jgi:hypothetical protein
VSPLGLGIFLFTTASRMALKPTQPPIQWIPGALSLGIKRPGRETGHSPPFSAEVKNAWSYTFIPIYVFMALCLVKHRDKFTFYLCSLDVTFIYLLPLELKIVKFYSLHSDFKSSKYLKHLQILCSYSISMTYRDV